MPTAHVATAHSLPARPLGVRVMVTLAGAMLVALAAQLAVPLPGTPVPMTLQPMAVLIVGGLLGPRLGALSLITYLAMGAAGLPVFTPGGLPGIARLFGPTGGYLLAFPFAAAVVGRAVGRSGGRAVREPGRSPSDETAVVVTALPSYRLTALSCLAAMVVIHAGGLAQLVVLTGSARSALAVGVVPFALGDLAKVAVAALVINRFLSRTRALG